MRKLLYLICFLGIFIISGCQPAQEVCPKGERVYQNARTPFPTPAGLPSAEVIEIKGKPIAFDQVVHGQLCDLTIRGKVYIACDVVVTEWKDTPNFFDACDFVVEPGTVIYVAAHNNAPYYKGCVSCHRSGGDQTP